MSENITRISDLPENITMQLPPYGVSTAPISTGNNHGMEPGGQNTYIPMNVHPNPYGNGQPSVMPPPITQPPRNEMYMGGGSPPHMDSQAMFQNIPQQRLPSRDIPIDTTDYLQDEQVQANYISKAKLSSDFVREYEDLTDKKLEKHEQKKYREKMIDKIIVEIQTPVIIALLFFVFQSPFVNSFLFKRFSVFSLYNSDGNINFYGLILKSILFGMLFYSITKFTQLLSEI
jgi:hypothetical protein